MIITKKNKTALTAFSVFFYIAAAALMIWGTTSDLEIDKVLFNPENAVAVFFEGFGEAVAWVLWGPVFSILLVSRRSFNGSLAVLGSVFPFVKPFGSESSKAYRFLDFVWRWLSAIGFFVGSVVGYKKLVENVLKKFLEISQPVYFVICAVIAAAAYLLLRRIDSAKLAKMEKFALTCLFLSSCIRICMYLKPISHRVRFREMVAASNGIFNEEGLSHGSLDKLVPRTNRGMMTSTDFSAYTPWYIKGDDMGIYNNPDSFPSGHTMSATCTFLSVIFCFFSKKLQKLAPTAMVLSAAYVFAMGYCRMVEGAHYMTDVACGALIGYTLFLVTVGICSLFEKKHILDRKD